MAKQARSAVTRRSILVGAAENFERHGFGSTTLNDVSARSGVTKGSLYFHFKSKEDLAKAVIDAHHEVLGTSTATALDEDRPGLEAVIVLSQGFADRLQDDVIVRAGVRLTLEQGIFDSLWSDSYRRWVDLIDELVHRAAVQGDLQPMHDPAAVARVVTASFLGVQVVSQVLAGRDMRERVAEMWELLLPALVPARKLAYFRRVVANHDGAEAELADRDTADT